MTKRENLKRFISYYQKDGEKLLGDVPLIKLDLAALRVLLQVADDDPLYDVYPIDEPLKNFLQRYTEHNINLGQYDYFLECSRTV